MLRALRYAAFCAVCLAFAVDAIAQEPIRIDRPKEGSAVTAEIEVAGVATPGATVEVWVDRVFIADTIAEPDGWYVARIKRPPNATEKSRIFVHELNPDGQRTSSAVVRVKWSGEAVAVEETPPPPDGMGDPSDGSDPTDPTDPTDPGETTVPDGSETTSVDASAQPPVRQFRSGRVAVEYLVSVTAGVTGAVIGLILASAIGAPDSGARKGANIVLGAAGGSMAAAGAVYGVGHAMQGNGSFAWTAVGGVAGAFLLVGVALATTDGGGALFVPAAIVAFALPVIGFELTSDVSRQNPAPVAAQPTVGVTRDGRPTIGLTVRF